MKQLELYFPLLGFLIPSIVIGYGFVIPGTCVAGWNELGIGFIGTLAGAVITYIIGIRRALSVNQQVE